MRKNTGKVREFCQSGKVGTMKTYIYNFLSLKSFDTKNVKLANWVNQICDGGIWHYQKLVTFAIWQQVILSIKEILKKFLHVSVICRQSINGNG